MFGIAARPYNYVMGIPFAYKLLFITSLIVISGIILPMVITGYKWIKAVCHPVSFTHKHVLITGGGKGLGKALVQEIFMRGAYITIIGQDFEKLLKVAQSLDVRMTPTHSWM